MKLKCNSGNGIEKMENGDWEDESLEDEIS